MVGSRSIFKFGRNKKLCRASTSSALGGSARHDPYGRLHERLPCQFRAICGVLWWQTIDSSLLLLPLIGFLPIDDARIASTIEAVERELTEDGMVRRKKSNGSESEGSFIACTFWLADCQNLQGRRKEARKTFERALAVRNDVGLLSEEYNVPGRCLAGNFPQALSHLTLITTVLGLSDSANQNSRF